MATCTSCGKQAPEGNTFCTVCGARLATPQPALDDNGPARRPPHKQENAVRAVNERGKNKKAFLAASATLIVFAASAIALVHFYPFRRKSGAIDSANNPVFQSRAIRNKPSLLWTFKAEGYPPRSIDVAYGKAFFMSSTTAYAINLKTGAVDWQFQLDNPARDEYGVIPGVPPNPAAAHNMVFFTDLKDHIYALDAYSGKLKWKYAFEQVEKTRRPHAPPLADENHLYLIRFGSLYSFNIETGAIINTHFVAENLSDRFVIYRDKAYLNNPFETNRSVLSLRNMTFIPWSERRIPVSSSAIFFGDIMYYTYDVALFAVNIETDTDEQTLDIPEKAGGLGVLYGDVLYLYRYEGSITAINMKTGGVEWSVDISVTSRPVAAGGVIYLSYKHGLGASITYNIAALDAKTGRMLWEEPVGKIEISKLFVVDGVIYFSDIRGRVYAYK